MIATPTAPRTRVDSDDDNDGLTDAVEESLNLNPCVGDTDADGVEDKYEYDCDRNGVLNGVETDDDGDLITDSDELRSRPTAAGRLGRRRRH